MKDTLGRYIMEGDDIVYAVKQSTFVQMTQACVVEAHENYVLVQPFRHYEDKPRRVRLTIPYNIVILAELEFINERERVRKAA